MLTSFFFVLLLLFSVQAYTLDCPLKCGHKLVGNVWYLLCEREGPHHDEGLGFLLCSQCGNKYIPLSGYPIWANSRKYGWRTIQEKEIRKYMEEEWEDNIARTRVFAKDLDEEKERRRNMRAICNAVADADAPAKAAKRKPVTRKRGRSKQASQASKNRKRSKKSKPKSKPAEQPSNDPTDATQLTELLEVNQNLLVQVTKTNAILEELIREFRMQHPLGGPHAPRTSGIFLSQVFAMIADKLTGAM